MTVTVLASIIAMLVGLLAAGVKFWDQDWTPKLALDLAGGTQIILAPVLAEGSEATVTESDLNEAVNIIRLRVNGSGVAEAEVTTQGGQNIVVSLPGSPSDEVLDLVRQTAQLQFRPVLVSLGPTGTGETELPDDFEAPSYEPATVPANPSDLAWATEGLAFDVARLDCTDPANLSGGDIGDPDKGVVMCASDGSEKYVLGPVELTGTDIASATSTPRVNSQGVLQSGYEVQLEFTSEGAGKFADTTRRLVSLDGDLNRFAIVLDGVVISAPTTNDAITGGRASISGSFDQKSAENLANQLKFGALPITLVEQNSEQIGASQGAEQLQGGLIAGAIGMLLVVLYSLVQYRALGLVTVASLVVAFGSTYVVISLLSWSIGYRLSLAGVVGLVVAIGITADSFIVYFERVRDELRDGRSLASAVEHAWIRARRTIMASDAVSLLAAIILYSVAVGAVRGFAFTLGLITLVDLIVVIMFTHPVLALLARTKFFSEGHKLSGLDPRQLGRDTLYKGRGRVSTNAQTLAERKAAAAKGEQS